MAGQILPMFKHIFLLTNFWVSFKDVLKPNLTKSILHFSINKFFGRERSGAEQCRTDKSGIQMIYVTSFVFYVT